MNFNAIGVVLKECDLLRQATLRELTKTIPPQIWSVVVLNKVINRMSDTNRNETSFRYYTLALLQECVRKSPSFRRLTPKEYLDDEVINRENEMNVQ